MYDGSNALHSEFISLISAQLQRGYLPTSTSIFANDFVPEGDATSSNNSLDDVVISRAIKSEEELVGAILSLLEGSKSIMESLHAVNFQPQQFEKVFLFFHVYF